MTDDVVKSIPICDIVVDDSFNCRGQFTDESIIELAASIRRDGLLQNILVSPRDDGKYDLVSGFRRLRSVKYLGWEFVDAKVKKLDTESRYRVNVIENLKRKDLNMVQEANGIQYFVKLGWDSGTIADYLNVSTQWVNVRLAVLKLPYEAQQSAAAGELTNSEILDLSRKATALDKLEALDTLRKVKKSRLKHKGMANATAAARSRRPGEITNLILHITHMFGPSLTTVALSWAAGAATDDALRNALRDRAEELGVEFTEID